VTTLSGFESALTPHIDLKVCRYAMKLVEELWIENFKSLLSSIWQRAPNLITSEYLKCGFKD